MNERTHVIQHTVKLTHDTPIPCKPYPLPYARREDLPNKVDSMLEMGVVKQSMSPYASHIVMIRNKDGSRISGLPQGPHPSLHQDLSAAVRPPQERKVRTSRPTME